ncbi:Transcriptional regulatory protein ZraR [Tepidimonas alkaliphilus]|uniref:Transcriptional regulatory protein ZraR n=1 Tax=Tepidimonas alkaliphilus TaxID=2588942 RepID=A0A554WDL8_9BURK|nr:sigma-54-dependent Fis family transcriptional regulator [Tepidimonas alkaliphilus]TSE21683.1 Transcriptional regulatory protein ZraR [Tepidimonas alkaliphilus]
MQSLHELIAFLESLPEPHILFDRHYRILAANTAYRLAFSPNGEVVGRRCYEVSHRFDRPCDQAGESCPLALSLRSGARERVLHLHHTPKGEEYVNIELTPLPDAHGKLHVFVEKVAALPSARPRSDEAAMLVGRSPAFQRMLARVARAAPAQASVLLLGESGTGKELVARAIHEGSPRASRPLVVVDCSSLPESLFESEVFGHEKGAFTGATHTKIGLVEAAHGGTLFLDEVGDIPMTMQVKLLRLLESGTYRRVGSTELRRTDVRVVSATHRDLEAMMRQGRFREDLYYRLSTFPIHLPPLRERREDIPLLAEALLRRVWPQRRLTLHPQALQRLMVHPFPGNVRELRNVLEHAALWCDGDEILPEHVEEALAAGRRAAPASTAAALAIEPDGPQEPPDEAPLPTARRERERETLRRALQAHHGSRAALAARLGISERTLYRKLKAHGLLDDGPGSPDRQPDRA